MYQSPSIFTDNTLLQFQKLLIPNLHLNQDYERLILKNNEKTAVSYISIDININFKNKIGWCEIVIELPKNVKMYDV